MSTPNSDSYTPKTNNSQPSFENTVLTSDEMPNAEHPIKEALSPLPSEDIYSAMLQEDRARRDRMVGDLRHSHARKRASLAARFNDLPRGSALDYYDDGVINRSAPYVNSRYRRNMWR